MLTNDEMWSYAYAVIFFALYIRHVVFGYGPIWRRLLWMGRPKPFRFLDLLPELRDEIYSHLLPTGMTCSPDRIVEPKPHILFTNRQIHAEAIDVLYLRTPFIFEINSRWWQDTTPGLRPPEDRARILLSQMQTCKAYLDNVQHVELKLDWPEWSWYHIGCENPPQYKRFGTMVAFLDYLETSCFAVVQMPWVNRVTILWNKPPSADAIPVLLRSLKVIRKAKFNIITIRLPEDSPISSSMLAEQQKDAISPAILLQQEAKENIAEMRGDLLKAANNREEFRRLRRRRRNHTQILDRSGN